MARRLPQVYSRKLNIREIEYGDRRGDLDVRLAVSIGEGT